MRVLSMLLIASIFAFTLFLTACGSHELRSDSARFEAIVSDDGKPFGINVIDSNLTFDDCRAYGPSVVCLEQIK